MDDAKRENNRIKRPKSDVKNVLSGYLQKRNYSALQTFETSKNQHLTHSLLESGVGRSNSILFSSNNNDPLAIDQNFMKFLTWLKVQTEEKHRCYDIEKIVGPLFCHLYLDILRGEQSEKAASFFKSHLSAVDKTKCDKIVNELINVFATNGDSSKLKEKFRSKKVIVDLNRESLAVLKKFVLENRHVVILQVLQSWFDFHESDNNLSIMKNDNNMHSNEFPKDAKYDELLNAIRNLKRKPVPIYNVKINNNKQSVSCGILKRQCGVVAFGENNLLKLMPLHCLNSLLNININAHQIKLTNHSGQIYSLAMSPNNNILVSASADHTICIYNLSDIRFLRRCRGHLGPIYCVKISSNGEYIATGSMDTTARLWDINTGKVLRVFAGHTQSVTCLDFHPNCLYITTGSADRNIRLWSLSKATPLRLLHAAKGTIYALSFNPSGRLLASASDDKKIRIWDLLTSKTIAELRCKDSPVVRLLWNRDGRELCAGTVDGVIRIWDLASIQKHWENNKSHEPIFLQSLNSKLLSIEYTLGSYGILTV